MPGLWRLGRFRTSYLLRATLCWVVVRGVLQAADGETTLIALLAGVGVTTAAVVLDARRRREDVFLGNLGISRVQIAGVAATAALFLLVVERLFAGALGLGAAG